MNYEQEQLIQQAFEKGPELLANQQIPEFFDTVYMPSIWDNRLQPLMIRLTLGTALINKLRDDQVGLLLSHATSSKQPLPQFLYAYWLIYNRERWTETPIIARMMRWAADCGIGDAAWTLRYLSRWGEAGKVDLEIADKCEQEAIKKGSVKAYLWQMENRIDDAEGDDLADLIDEFKERYISSEDPIFLILLAKALIKCNDMEAAEQCARRAIDCGIVERGYECLRDIYTRDEDGEELDYEDWEWDRLLPILEDGASHEDPISMNLLVLCADDYGCDDTSRLPQLLQRSAQLGYGDSCYDLAIAINEGKYNLKQDMEQAWYWFHRGAMCGHVESFFNLYLMSSFAEDKNADQTDMAFYHTDRLKDRMPAADWERLAKTVFEANKTEWLGDYKSAQSTNETAAHDKGVKHTKITYPNGDEYLGCVDEDNLPHGWGVMEYAERDEDENGVEYDDSDWLSPHCPEKYEGMWVHGKREGKGEMHYYVNGHCSRSYEGMWKNDKRHGKGTLSKIWFVGTGSYELSGNWVDDQMPLHGKLRESSSFNNFRYEGDLKDGKPDGRGKCQYHNGIYEGEFQKGSRHGHGIFIFDNGDQYEGEWRNNGMEGLGHYRLANGQEFDGQWENGTLNEDTLRVIGNVSTPVIVAMHNESGLDYSHGIRCFFIPKVGKIQFEDTAVLQADSKFPFDKSFIEIEEVTADSITFIVNGCYFRDSKPQRDTIRAGEKRVYRDLRECVATIEGDDVDYEILYELKLACIPGKPA